MKTDKKLEALAQKTTAAAKSIEALVDFVAALPEEEVQKLLLLKKQKSGQ